MKYFLTIITFAVILVVGLPLATKSSRYPVIDCNRNYMGEVGSGILSSPNYPFNYHGMEECSYKIFMPKRDDPSKKYQVCFVFHRFQLAYSDRCTEGPSLEGDYLMFPGRSSSFSGHRLYCYRGASTPKPEENNHVMNPEFCWEVQDEIFEINFVSDKFDTDTGFFATFTISEMGTLDEDTTELGENGAKLMPKSNDMTVFREMCLQKLDKPRTPEEMSLCQLWFLQAIGKLSPTVPCQDDEFMCHNRQCCPLEAVCDGIADCADKTDEDYLTARCDGAGNVLEACNFDATPTGSYCQFTGFNWILGTSSPNGPRHDHSFLPSYYGTPISSAGHFVYTSFGLNEVTLWSDLWKPYPSRLRSLSFWFFMRGECGLLEVYISREVYPSVGSEGMDRPVWSRRDHQGEDWVQGQILIPENTSVSKIAFKASRGNDRISNIGLDDVSIIEGKCYLEDISCMFELSGFCGWENSADSDLKWFRNNGKNTKVTDRHGDFEAWYIMVDSTDEATDNTATLLSPPVSNHHPSGTNCFRFWYRMFGPYIPYLYVSILRSQGDGKEVLLRRHVGDTPGDMWLHAAVTITTTEPYRIILEAFRTDSYGDKYTVMGVDDVELVTGKCMETGDGEDGNGDEGTTDKTTPPPPSGCGKNQFRCQDGECISDRLACDGRFDCVDMSDETNCESAAQGDFKVGVVIGIVTGAIFGTIVIMAFIIVCLIKRRQVRAEEDDRNSDMTEMTSQLPGATPSGTVVVTNMGDPPPLYSETEGQPQGHMGRVTVSLSWEPPPVYDIAITGRPARPPSYGTATRGRAGGPNPRTTTRGSVGAPRERSIDQSTGNNVSPIVVASSTPSTAENTGQSGVNNSDTNGGSNNGSFAGGSNAEDSNLCSETQEPQSETQEIETNDAEASSAGEITASPGQVPPPVGSAKNDSDLGDNNSGSEDDGCDDSAAVLLGSEQDIQAHEADEEEGVESCDITGGVSSALLESQTSDDTGNS